MLPKSADVVIVGGGVIGCATAFWLAKAGVTPLLPERDQLASEASGESDEVLSPHPRTIAPIQHFILQIRGVGSTRRWPWNSGRPPA
jgi:glycine/D-amino acid oxidase-like deaminating enzyme